MGESPSLRTGDDRGNSGQCIATIRLAETAKKKLIKLQQEDIQQPTSNQ